MASGEAAELLRRWFTAHLRTVGRALSWFGVASREDRADLTQDVFVTAYQALARGEKIDNPRAWLRECARKHASNYRHKELRRAPALAEGAVSTVLDPERLTSDRERLFRAFDSLDEDAQDLVFDIRADERGWAEVAAERGITVDQARYLYRRAVTQMEEVLKRDDSNEKVSRSIGPPIALLLIESGLRADADDLSPDTRRRIWDSIEQRIDASFVHAVDPAGAEGARGAPLTRTLPQAPTPRLELGATLGLLGGGIAIGIVIGYLLRGPLPLVPAPTSGIVEPPSTTAPSAPLPETTAVAIAAPVPPTLPDPATTTRDPPAFPAAPRLEGTSAKARSSPRAMKLLDLARAAFAAGDALAALDLLTQHAHQFSREQDAGQRRLLLQLICAAPEARGARECAERGGAPPDHLGLGRVR